VQAHLEESSQSQVFPALGWEGAMHSFNSRDCRGRLIRLFFTIPSFLLLVSCGVRTPAPQATVPSSQTENRPPGDTTRVLIYAGIERKYVLHIPVGYTATRPTPLVLAFHGIGLDSEEMIRISRLSEQADKSGFVVVYPNGTGVSKSWNGGHCCGEAAKNNVDDVGFVRVLFDELSAWVNIDPGRVYATGFSNGAIMAYRLACEMSDRIAAIGPVSATQILDDQRACHPARSVPVIHFHGTADRLNPYEGGATSAGFKFVSVKDAIGFWAEKNACSAPPQRREAGTIQHDVYAACAQNTTIELYSIIGGEHAWPGGEAVNLQIGKPTMEIFASPLMWEFFAAHPMR
jgi:polyhydroxybutyrate depolymerase